MMKIVTEELKKFVEENPSLVTRKESKRYPGLFVLKYAKRVFYDNLWHKNPLLLECRGLVVDKDYNIVVKPFTKVFNHGENGTTFSDDTLCRVVRKVNGFMACVTKHENYPELIISTTGSLDSDFVKMARAHFNERSLYANMYDDETLIFEICDKSDPHIISEKLGPYLIGGNGRCTDGISFMSYPENVLNDIANQNGFMRPEVYKHILFEDVLSMVKLVKHEGFMVYDEKSGGCLKLKSPHYLVTKFLARLGDTKFDKIFRSGNLDLQKMWFDEEYYPLLTAIKYTYKDQFQVMNEQERIQFIRNFLEKG